MKRVLGLVVAGGDGLLAELGVAEAALTPFAGKYRFIDFALATLVNSNVGAVHVATARRGPALRADLMAAARGVGVLRRPLPVRLPASARRGERSLRALLGCRHLARAHAAETVVVLLADHVLRLELGGLVEAHRRRGVDVTLCAMPLPAADLDGRAALDVARDGRVRVHGCPAGPGPDGLVHAWTGELVANAAVLPALAALLGTEPRGRDSELLEVLACGARVAAHDPVASDRAGVFWHDPVSIEAYYDAHMDLCTPRPALDLYDPAWPLRPVGRALAPAKVVADAAGRPGQTLNSLVSDGAVVRGGIVLNTVLGHGVVVESGAEIEDSVLLDGCRVGRGARVRRAVVGVGAVIGDAGEIGYGSPASPARVLPSRLTVVPPILDRRLAAASA